MITLSLHTMLGVQSEARDEKPPELATRRGSAWEWLPCCRDISRSTALAEQQMVELVKSTTAFPNRSDANVTLAVDRTRLSYERTLMSWIRTATSLITFGFSIYKFFEIESERTGAANTRLIGSREFAIMMIAIGLTSLLLATIEHSRDLSALKAQYPHAKFPRSTARLMAGLISLLGVSAIVAAVFRQ